MNYKKEALELLGYEQVDCLIPKNLLNDFPDYFTDEQQPPLATNLSEITENGLIFMSALSQTTTPQLSAQLFRSAQSKNSKGKIRTFFPQKWPVAKTNMSPFSFSRYSHFQSLIIRNWYYLDNINNIQGPFSCVEMDNWYRKNLLNADLLISYKSRDLTSFVRVQDILQESQNPKCSKILKQMYKRASSAIRIQQRIQSDSPISKASTELSLSNNNSCQKQRQPIWGVDTEYLLSF
ncbi:unnamed protein product (macronuclear) [Paramecium tetraurelia]|uniref:GYF domain-containing protein n=1 Tax=Paramecium tetraurelia TaxID=5888 RepID=A0CFQ9_PARTE|nr:uncharacterized protein GSPATT00038067001 [Paramecium tetraurelia]CAK69626.1 unnamed protein product [Paramecium tetraurelia]|eukprot:XP_001437023.1 hypothetical protein (macronuclear) [Paramecium tetraurelia strain d4-2]